MTNLNEKRKEQISALFDNEQQLEGRHLGADLEYATERYSLIGDVMRAQGKDTIQIDIASQVAVALEQEDTYSQKVDQKSNLSIKALASSFHFRKPFAQLAIAASVAAVAVVGVQNMSQQQNDGIEFEPHIQNLETMPFGGTATPVSFSTEPALETAQKGLRELEERRLGALIKEHQRQARIAQAAKDNSENLENQK